MKIKLDEGAFAPIRCHETDAGLDIRSPLDVIVPPSRIIYDAIGNFVRIGSATIDTGVHIELPHGRVGLLKSKSGLNVKHGITSEGVIDEAYRGSIRAKLYNHTENEYLVKRGDKITQLLVMPCDYVECELADELGDTDRGENGFGSSGR